MEGTFKLFNLFSVKNAKEVRLRYVWGTFEVRLRYVEGTFKLFNLFS